MNSRGFTLVELIVTVVIVGLLATVAMPLAELTVRRAKETELRTALRDIRTAVDAYKLATEQGRVVTELGASGYPADLDSLVTGVEDAKSPKRVQIYFLRRLPRDPLYPDRTAVASVTWGLRSYESSPDNPQRGADVFDIYSLAEGDGLDGVPYRDW